MKTDHLYRLNRYKSVFLFLDFFFVNYTAYYRKSNVTTNTYQYDSLGYISAVTDALKNKKETTYNLVGLPETVTEAETKAKGLPYTVKYTYNGISVNIPPSCGSRSCTTAYGNQGFKKE